MHTNPFGNTGLNVSALGFGAGHIGSPDLTEDHVGWLLNEAVDLGITLFDTARGYGLSEERIGRHLSWRRGQILISSKGGYGVAGVPDWTTACITQGIDQALERLRTDYLDVFHLHSCPTDVLEQGEVIEALHKAMAQGKIRVAAYSGDNAPLLWAVQSGRFGSVECSLNICDQHALHHTLPTALARGMGIIAKRPLANAPWRYAERPVGQYAEVYWQRLETMQLESFGLPWDELALRFAAFAPGVSSAIVGTASLENLRHNVGLIAKGALPPEIVQHVVDSFSRHGTDWLGEI
jgi:aryl-alcohol dehydrogenase-like predicted oxidoreductase